MTYNDDHNITLCIHCDAPPGQCAHAAGRYYNNPIRMQPITKNGKHVGYVVDERDRARWEAPTVRATPPVKPSEQPRPIQHLIADLEAWIDLRPKLERRIREAHARSPLRLTRAVTAVVDGAEHNRLSNPTGVLISRLREIEAQQPEYHQPAEPDDHEPALLTRPEYLDAEPRIAGCTGGAGT